MKSDLKKTHTQLNIRVVAKRRHAILPHPNSMILWTTVMCASIMSTTVVQYYFSQVKKNNTLLLTLKFNFDKQKSIYYGVRMSRCGFYATSL